MNREDEELINFLIQHPEIPLNMAREALASTRLDKGEEGTHAVDGTEQPMPPRFLDPDEVTLFPSVAVAREARYEPYSVDVVSFAEGAYGSQRLEASIKYDALRRTACVKFADLLRAFQLAIDRAAVCREEGKWDGQAAAESTVRVIRAQLLEAFDVVA